jgi:hypothetical protein
VSLLSPGCIVGSALSVAAILSDPDVALQRVTDTTRGELAELEVLGRVAIALDTGPSPLRWAIGLRPALDRTPEILGDGAAEISREVAAMTPLLPALRAARRPAPPATTGLEDAIATWIVDAIRPPDATVPPEARQALAHVEQIQHAVGRARLRLVAVVLGLGGLRWLECLGLGLAVRAWIRRRSPRLQPPAASPLGRPPSVATTRWRWPRPKPSSDPIEAALTASGVPGTLAFEIAAHFAEAPDWPGSLRGHDRQPGGLRRHTLRVLRSMTEATANWPHDARAAAAVIAAAHDLGKLIAYRRLGPDRWIGATTTPHDSLSAILLMQCPSWPVFALAELRAAILQALFSEHAPEGLPANASPLAGELLAILARVDADAAQKDTSAAHPTVEATTREA